MLYQHRHLSSRDQRERALKALEMVGLAERAGHHPNQLSGGQQQRVAIARALVNQPALLLADEPTGNLDKRNTEIVFDVFQRLAVEFNHALLVVTHDTGFAEKTQRIIEMEDGKILKQ